MQPTQCIQSLERSDNDCNTMARFLTRFQFEQSEGAIDTFKARYGELYPREGCRVSDDNDNVRS